MRRRHFFLAALLLVTGLTQAALPDAAAFAWPEATREARPWTYWWWMGSAVDEAEISALLATYRKAGLGGVHIIPIYGVKGYEERYRPFLGPAWLAALRHTIAEAGRLDLGVDMTTGTGWPFGGPQVTPEAAAAKVVTGRYQLEPGRRLAEKLPAGKLAALMAFSEKGEALDLAARVDAAGKLDWSPTEGAWRLYALAIAPTGQNVKRAAPGGAGKVVDPFSRAALAAYLAAFDMAFESMGDVRPRAQYHDSYEYYGADWTPRFFEQFAARRGYDLRAALPLFAGEGPEDEVARVKADWRATIADVLLEEFTEPWAAWCRAKGCLSRNQAHGSPGNILDLYAAADIPETEIFGPSGFAIPGLRTDPTFANDRPDPLMLKFASSAAHVAGKRLVSSETCTWLAEHFTVSLAQAKPEIDQLFAAGINHVFFHGTTYSPPSEDWPGWLFYASTNFGPSSGFYRDLPELNAYIARCQSLLQAGTPANDVLLYFPIHDVWHASEGGLIGLSVHSIGKWLDDSAFGRAARELWRRGHAFDYVSDRLLASVRATREGITSPGGTYRVVAVPRCRFMPHETLERLVELARAGGTVVFEGELPRDVPGRGVLAERREKLQAVIAKLSFAEKAPAGVKEAAVGAGTILVGEDLPAMLERAGARREPVAEDGIVFVRRAAPEGHVYFLANLGARELDRWVALGVEARAAVIMDPRRPDRTGKAAVRQTGKAAHVYLQLAPGESCIVRTFAGKDVEGPRWTYLRAADSPQARAIDSTWRVTFIEGGPRLPASYQTASLASWTESGGDDAKAFAGTAVYATTFQGPQAAPGIEWVLDLGQVCESARVRLNGTELGAVWSFPFRLRLGDRLLGGENRLEVQVTNLAANRIADMDRRGVAWKKFHEINFVDIRYKPFDASTWPAWPSGLLGPVRLIPARVLDAAALAAAPESAAVAREEIGSLAVLAPSWHGEVIAKVDQSYLGWDVEIGDADGDGANEVLATGCPASRLYLFEKRDAGWASTLLAEDLARRGTKPGMGLAVRIADLDGDGRHETIVGTGQETAEQAYLYVLRIDGARVTHRIASRPSLAGSAYTHNLGIFDVDGDGIKEIFAAYCGSGEVVRYDPARDLSALERRTVFQLTGSGEDTALADVDNDGAVELVVCDSYRDDRAQVRVFELDARGELVTPCRVTIEGFDGQPCFDCAAEIGDVDGDGAVELVVGWNRKAREPKGTIIAYRVDGGGAKPLYAFAREEPRLDLGYFEKMMAIADADNDGKPELVVSTRGERTWGGGGLGHVFVYEVGPGGEIGATLVADFLPGKADSVWIAVGDADNDGKQEIVAATGAGDREKPGESYLVVLRAQE